MGKFFGFILVWSVLLLSLESVVGGNSLPSLLTGSQKPSPTPHTLWPSMKIDDQKTGPSNLKEPSIGNALLPLVHFSEIPFEEPLKMALATEWSAERNPALDDSADFTPATLFDSPFEIMEAGLSSFPGERETDEAEAPAPKSPPPPPSQAEGAPPCKTTALKKAGQAKKPFDSIILQAARRHKVDPALVRAIIMTESEYNPRAVSKKGARGLMQLMPRTARVLGVKDIFNPEENIHAGVKHFKYLLERFDGRIKLAVAAYHAGSSNVAKYNGVPPLRATRHYVKKVIGYYEIYKKETTRAAPEA